MQFVVAFSFLDFTLKYSTVSGGGMSHEFKKE